MANGFGEGYFGIQVNGPNERRVLFSVWSPFKPIIRETFRRISRSLLSVVASTYTSASLATRAPAGKASSSILGKRERRIGS